MALYVPSPLFRALCLPPDLQADPSSLLLLTTGRNVPSYPTCNLFFRQLLHTSPPSLSTLFPTLSSTSLSDSNMDQAIETASVGVDPVCGLGRLGVGHGVGGTANVVLCAVAIPVVIAMVWATWRRNAAVGRLEFVLLLTVCPLLVSPLSSQGTFWTDAKVSPLVLPRDASFPTLDGKRYLRAGIVSREIVASQHPVNDC